MLTLIVKTDRRTQFLDVTAQVQKAVSAAKISNGICYLYVPHTTAGIAINECADPDVVRWTGSSQRQGHTAIAKEIRTRTSKRSWSASARPCSSRMDAWRWDAGKGFSSANLMARASRDCK